MPGINWKWRCQKCYRECNCNSYKAISDVNSCSVRVPSLPTWWRHPRIHSDCCGIIMCRSGHLGNSSLSTHFIHSAALLQAVLWAKTEPVRNGLVETRKIAVELRNGLGTLLFPAQRSSTRSAGRSHELFRHEFMNCYKKMIFYLMIFMNSFQFWKKFWSFCCYFFYCVGAGISILMSFSDGLGPYIFRQKMEKTRPMRQSWIEICLLTTKIGIFVYIKRNSSAFL